MPKGQFVKDYWEYRKNGGKLSMKDFSVFRKQVTGEENAAAATEVQV